tara:strand:- start:160919 stop:161665 length:747 start_codon:yes stop_codon:yes gene_type:complete
MKKTLQQILIFITLTLTLASCAIKQDNGRDPFEKYNRNAYRANDKVDRWVLKPTAEGYDYVTPYFMRAGVSNFFDNLDTMPAFINDAAQGHAYWFFNDFWRFTINSTIGIAGLFDVASKMGLEKHKNGFGMTLAAWGAKDSPYIMLPIFGPNTLNSSFGIVFNYYSSPWYFLLNDPNWLPYGLYLFEGVNERAMLLNEQSLFNGLALDPYVFMRSAYLQHRAYQLKINNTPPIPKHEDPRLIATDPEF